MEHIATGIFQGPPTMGPPLWYSSHIFRDSYGSGMGIVWEASHKGVLLLGVPGITLDIGTVYTKYIQWLFLVPLKGGIGGIVHPPSVRKNATYIPLIVLAFWGVICYRSHLLGEPETTIDI